MTKSDELQKKVFSEKTSEILHLHARNRTNSKDEVPDIKHGLMLMIIKLLFGEKDVTYSFRGL